MCFSFGIGLGFEDEEGFGLRSEEVAKGMELSVRAMADVMADYEEQRTRGSSRGLLSSKHHRRDIFLVRSVASMGMRTDTTHQQSIHKKESPGNKKDKVAGAMPRLYPKQGGGFRNQRAASEYVSFTRIMRGEWRSYQKKVS